MLIKQLSVFLENKPGSLEETLRIIKEKNVNIRALSLADTSEFGLLRLIVDKPEEAKDALKAAGFTSILNDVLEISLQQRVGYLQELVSAVSAAGINVEYMYAASSNTSSATLMVKTSDIAKTAEIIEALS